MFRILVLEPNFSENGAIRISLDRARRWATMGAEVTVLFVSGQSREGGVAFPAGVRMVVANGTVKSTRRMIPVAVLLGLLHARRADVIVVGRELGPALLAGSLLATITRTPLSVTVQSNFERSLQQYATSAHRNRVLTTYRRAQLLVAVARGLVGKLTDVGVSPERIAVVLNGIDVPHVLREAQAHPSLPLPALPFIMASGRLARQKGFDTLIRAHALALQQGCPQHQLVIAGDGPDRPALERLAAELGVSASVTLAGFLDNPFPVLRQATLFVLSSRWEGLPLVLTEAQALGVATVAVDCVSGPRELLADGQYGTLVPPDDVGALADAIASHFRTPELLKRKAEDGRQAAIRHLSAAGAAEQHFNLLRGLARHEPTALT